MTTQNSITRFGFKIWKVARESCAKILPKKPVEIWNLPIDGYFLDWRIVILRKDYCALIAALSSITSNRQYQCTSFRSTLKQNSEHLFIETKLTEPEVLFIKISVPCKVTRVQ